MKKLFFGASLMFIAAGFYSCAPTPINNTEVIEFAILDADWIPFGTLGSPGHVLYYPYATSSITSDIFNNGAILAYIGDSTQWQAMPSVVAYTGYIRTYGYAVQIGAIAITVQDSDLQTVSGGNVNIKVVLVKQKDMPLLDGADLNNYDEVAELLDLKK